MNKISKKIVALVTMAAFVLTLVPAAAFAANVSSKVSVEDSEIALSGNPLKATAVVDLDLVATDAGDNAIVWVTTGDNVLYRYADFTKVEGGAEVQTGTSETGDWLNYGVFTVTTAGTHKMGVVLKEAGTYTIHVGSNIGHAQTPADIGTKVVELGTATVTVKDATSTVKAITANDVSYANKPDGVTPSPAITATVTGQYEGATATNSALEGKVVAIKTPAGFTAYDEDGAITEATTNDQGKITFNLIADKNVVAGVYTLKLTCEGVTKNVLVTVPDTEDTVAKTVEAVDTGKDLVEVGTTDLSSVAKVVFKNAAGEAVTIDAGTFDKQVSTRIMEKPEKFDGDINVNATPIGDTKTYKLEANKNLVAGDYTVRVALTNKDSVDISFTASEFGDVVSSKIVVTKTGEDDAVTNVYEDEGQYTGTVYVVDENGLEKVVKDGSMLIGILKGASAVKNFNATPANGTFNFEVEDDSQAGQYDNAQIGTDIQFMAFAPDAGVTNATATVTVADSANIQAVELNFDSEAGEIGKYNTVNVTLVDANGDKVVKSITDVKAYVVEKSAEDANVQVSMGSITKGKGELRVYSDKETTADILVVAKDGNVIYANTLTYAFGEQDIPVDTSVVMTIGSNDFVVNNEVVSVADAAPYVANDRTYVPFRALGEALGAKVEWDNDARTVTYTLGKTEVVMTIGEKTYTVNGEEKTMDVAPEITNDRTYVPVRFVGEALGFKVTALSAADGTTASVVFQK